MDYEIISVEKRHFSEWRRLREGVYSGIDAAFHETEMRQVFQNKDWHIMLAIVEPETACGMIEVSLRNFVDGCLSRPVGYVEGIYVDPDFRNQGIARGMIEHAEDWCRSRGCSEFATDSEIENHEAQRFHRHLGFEETYRTVGYRKSL